jgi:CRISPR-associated protein (TIGR03984 family)
MTEKTLELNPVSSRADWKPHELSDFSSLEALTHDRFGDIGFGVFYLDNEVLVGKYDGNKFYFYEGKSPNPRFLQKMRLFNPDKELLLWRKKWGIDSGNFVSRLRADNEGKQIEAVDALQLLWGKASKKDDDFIELSDNRGMKIIIPLKNADVNDGERIFIKTRNYVTYETDDPSYMQASYFDCRFISFMDKDGKKLGW